MDAIKEKHTKSLCVCERKHTIVTAVFKIGIPTYITDIDLVNTFTPRSYYIAMIC